MLPSTSRMVGLMYLALSFGFSFYSFFYFLSLLSSYSALSCFCASGSVSCFCSSGLFSNFYSSVLGVSDFLAPFFFKFYLSPFFYTFGLSSSLDFDFSSLISSVLYYAGSYIWYFVNSSANGETILFFPSWSSICEILESSLSMSA